jgi:hypothetical protein
MLKTVLSIMLTIWMLSPDATTGATLLEREVPCVEVFDPQDLIGEDAVRYVFNNSEFVAQTEFIVAQCKFESYNFQSNLYLKDHNFVGMGVAYKRPQNRIGTNRKGEHGRPTAVYATDYDCALDLLSWYQHHGNYFCESYTPDEFVTKLKEKRYFGAKHSIYLNGVKRWMDDKPDKAYWLDEIS